MSSKFKWGWWTPLHSPTQILPFPPQRHQYRLCEDSAQGGSKIQLMQALPSHCQYLSFCDTEIRQEGGGRKRERQTDIKSILPRCKGQLKALLNACLWELSSSSPLRRTAGCTHSWEVGVAHFLWRAALDAVGSSQWRTVALLQEAKLFLVKKLRSRS